MTRHLVVIRAANTEANGQRCKTRSAC